MYQKLVCKLYVLRNKRFINQLAILLFLTTTQKVLASESGLQETNYGLMLQKHSSGDGLGLVLLSHEAEVFELPHRLYFSIANHRVFNSHTQENGEIKNSFLGRTDIGLRTALKNHNIFIEVGLVGYRAPSEWSGKKTLTATSFGIGHGVFKLTHQSGFQKAEKLPGKPDLLNGTSIAITLLLKPE